MVQNSTILNENARNHPAAAIMDLLRHWQVQRGAHWVTHIFSGRGESGCFLFIWLAFQVWFVWASSGFVHSDDSSKKVVNFPLVPVQQGLYDCIALPLLHLGNVMEYPTSYKFAVTQNVVQNVEHSFVTYSDFHCYLTCRPSAISIQQRSKESNCVVLQVESSCTEVVLNGIPAFPERFNWLIV